MSDTPLTIILAFLAQVPFVLASIKPHDRANKIFMAALALAIVGPAFLLSGRLSAGWQVDLSGALWATVVGTLLVFAGVSQITREGWRLGILAAPYMAILALAATAYDLFASDPGDTIVGGPTGWLIAHAVVSILTYAVATMGAIAAAAGYFQQRALKQKTPSALSRRLPSLTDCDTLQRRLLSGSAIVLALGLSSGLATSLARTGALYDLDHKTVLGILAFTVIAVLLIADRRGGIRARQTGRTILVAYLLLSLAYLGVKFVTDVLL